MTKTLENIIDELGAVLRDVPPVVALDALTAVTIGLTQYCADPNRALLAVITKLGTLVRFCEAQDSDEDGVLPQEEWIDDAWKIEVP